MSREPGDDFQTAFWAAKHALSVATAAAFSRHGVHEGQQFILRCLWEQDGPTPGEIARRLGLATPTVTRATARMEAAGLLYRQAHPGDRRLVRLMLTERGRSLEGVIAAETDRLTERALATFDPAEREAVIRALRDILRNLARLARPEQGSRMGGFDLTEVAMSTGAIIVIVIVVVLAAAAVVAASELRRARMRRQFGPEYDRMAKELGRRKADAELAARQRRVAELGIHPLTAEQQASYAGDWTAVQERFVDAPPQAVTEAGKLIWDVMRDRGYPADNTDASMEALSVHHGRMLDGYRQARDVEGRADSASTEQLREAMICYRTLLGDLIGLPDGALSRREASARTVDTPR